MLFRQRVLLELIRCAAPVKPLRLFKLAFLLARTNLLDRNEIYDFVPYRYGPYSFTLKHELDKFQEDGLVLSFADGFQSASSSPMDCSIDARLAVARLQRQYSAVETGDLVKSVYKAFPWFTINASAAKSRGMERPKAAPSVYTIGYEGLTVEAFLDKLIQAGVTRLVDVRSNPVARRFGFHGSTLKRLSHKLGIEYVHLPHLGVASSVRKQLGADMDYPRFFSLYRTSMESAEGDLQLACTLATGGDVAFMCKEAVPERCHRSELAKLIAKRVGLPIIELTQCTTISKPHES